MRIAVGADHAGWETKDRIVRFLREQGHEVDDLGTSSGASVDYPRYAYLVARRVASGEADRGVLVCGTGIGMSIAANRVAGARAAVCHDEFTAKMAREHNDANVLCLGGRVVAPERALALAEIFVTTGFGEGRHAPRVAMFDAPPPA